MNKKYIKGKIQSLVKRPVQANTEKQAKKKATMIQINHKNPNKSQRKTLTDINPKSKAT
jgi:hypothetical protein